ncbi:unnamed protein product [Caenorhabditis auriculariae]|uniref:Uncharacterized protein n=1 Tax=Caenorhabditis auriculariae TaxID=2777116 RepID=A0A8S1HWW1_9PELO|nr:unnamed protein product [Caenorhabditis auriculariae]
MFARKLSTVNLGEQPFQAERERERQDPGENQEISFTWFEPKIGSSMEPRQDPGENQEISFTWFEPKIGSSMEPRQDPGENQEISFTWFEPKIGSNMEPSNKLKPLVMPVSDTRRLANRKCNPELARCIGECGINSITERITTRFVVKDDRFLEPGEHSSGKRSYFASS